jgi:hypothetical protein
MHTKQIDDPPVWVQTVAAKSGLCSRQPTTDHPAGVSRLLAPPRRPSSAATGQGVQGQGPGVPDGGWGTLARGREVRAATAYESPDTLS